jgi:hypothetical protein
VFRQLGYRPADPRNAGLKALLSVCQLDARALSAPATLPFASPRLKPPDAWISPNASSNSLPKKMRLCGRNGAQLSDSTARQLTERSSMNLPSDQLQPDLEGSFAVVAGDNFHRGVIGICATRVVERYHRPAPCFPAKTAKPGSDAHQAHLLSALESFPEVPIWRTLVIAVCASSSACPNSAPDSTLTPGKCSYRKISSRCSPMTAK